MLISLLCMEGNDAASSCPSSHSICLVFWSWRLISKLTFLFFCLRSIFQWGQNLLLLPDNFCPPKKSQEIPQKITNNKTTKTTLQGLISGVFWTFFYILLIGCLKWCDILYGKPTKRKKSLQRLQMSHPVCFKLNFNLAAYSTSSLIQDCVWNQDVLCLMHLTWIHVHSCSGLVVPRKHISHCQKGWISLYTYNIQHVCL